MVDRFERCKEIKSVVAADNEVLEDIIDESYLFVNKLVHNWSKATNVLKFKAPFENQPIFHQVLQEVPVLKTFVVAINCLIDRVIQDDQRLRSNKTLFIVLDIGRLDLEQVTSSDLSKRVNLFFLLLPSILRHDCETTADRLLVLISLLLCRFRLQDKISPDALTDLLFLLLWLVAISIWNALEGITIRSSCCLLLFFLNLLHLREHLEVFLVLFLDVVKSQVFDQLCLVFLKLDKIDLLDISSVFVAVLRPLFLPISDELFSFLVMTSQDLSQHALRHLILLSKA